MFAYTKGQRPPPTSSSTITTPPISPGSSPIWLQEQRGHWQGGHVVDRPPPLCSGWWPHPNQHGLPTRDPPHIAGRGLWKHRHLLHPSTDHFKGASRLLSVFFYCILFKCQKHCRVLAPCDVSLQAWVVFVRAHPEGRCCRKVTRCHPPVTPATPPLVLRLCHHVNCFLRYFLHEVVNS